MRTMQQVVTEAFDAIAAEDQWDRPAQLDLLVEHKGEVLIQNIPVPEYVWGAGNGDPKMVMMGMALLLQMDPRNSVPYQADGELLGLILTNEAWGLRLNKNEGEAQDEFLLRVERLKEWARNNRIEDHPDRVETKMCTAVTLAGEQFTATLHRGTDPEYNFADRDGGTPFTGDVPDILHALLLSIAAAQGKNSEGTAP